MKKAFISFTLLLIGFSALAGVEINNPAQTGNDLNNIDDFKKDTLHSDFKSTFATNDDLTNFRKLRSYLQLKQNAITLIQEELSYYSDVQRNIEAINNKTAELDRVVDDAKKNKLNEASIDVYFPACNIDIYGTNMTSLEKLKEVKEQLKTCMNKELARQAEYNALKANLNIVKKDYATCQEQIDTSLAPEYKDQEFRKTISIGFACLLGGLLLVFVAVVFRSQKNIARYFFSDTGLQFITLFVLIISIILFGILKILEGRELAAILSGIAGYILGKSRPNKAEKEEPEAEENKTLTNTK
ncbi:MAG: hypothetical protein J0L87_12495 [Bacteroidetes bacterium]|nr:hypothetical protein [Bacteroidota bacterium]